MRRVKSASRRSNRSNTRSGHRARRPIALLESLESRWLLSNDAPAMAGADPLAAINEDAINSSGTLVSALIGAHGTDADNNVLGIAVTGAVNTDGKWQYSMDNGTTWGELGTPSTAEARLLAPDAKVRFVPNADWNGTVTNGLAFRGWDQTSGTAGTTVDVTSNGGVTPYSSEEVYSNITVNAVNDVPSFTKGADQTAAEDEITQVVNGWATAISVGPANESGQTLSFKMSTDNDALFAALPEIDDTGKLTYTPAADANGVATVTVTLKDDGGTALGGVEASTQTFTITITAVNDAPVLAGTQDLTAIDEDASSNAGTLVSALIAGQITDVDSAALQGIAITAVDTTNGTWEYTTNGGTNWTVIAGVADTTALLLASNANTRVRFVPAADWNGTVATGLTFRGWDQTTGTAGTQVDTATNGTTTAFSSATAQADITVNAVNDVPSFTKGADQTAAEDEITQVVDGWATAISVGAADEAAQTLSFKVNTNNDALFSVLPEIDDTGKLTYTPAADANGVATVTVTLKDNGGTALGGVDASATQTFTITITAVNDAPSFVKGEDQTIAEDAAAQSLVSWATGISAGPAGEAAQALSFEVSTDNDALFSVLPAIDDTGKLTYTPAADANGVATVTVTLKDNGGTALGGVDASAAQTFTITLTAVNDAPVFTKGVNQTAAEDEITQVVDGWATLISAGPADEAAQALSFEVSTDNDALFIALPAIDSSGRLTYTPAADANGVATVTVRLKDDGGTALGGVDASAAQTFTITLTAVNDAPVLAGTQDLTAIDEDAATNSGTLVSALIAGHITDVDSGALTGIAITAVDTTNGTWEYTTNGGTNWTAIAGVVDATALLLAANANTRVRFVPAADWNGTVATGLTFRGWDQSTGTAGTQVDTATNGTTTAFSSATASANLVVNAVNDIPSFTKGGDQTVAEDEITQVVDGWATGISAGPADEAAQALSFEVSTDNDALFIALPAIDSSGRLTYTPAADANGVATVTVRLKDDGGTALGGVDASAAQTFTITLTAVNDVPSFTKGDDQLPVTGSTTHLARGWATGIFAGPDDESAQALSFTITTDNDSMFAVLPQIDPETGDLTYTLANGATGSATVSVVLTDDGGTDAGGADTSDVQQFTVTVSSNTPPTANNDTYETDEDTPLVIEADTGVLANDDDVNGTELIVAVETQPAHGKLTLNEDGSFTYTPDADWSGTDTFTYYADDGLAQSDPATVTITVNSVNDAPSFTKGADQCVLKNAGAQTIPGWATGISVGPANEADQTLSSQVTTSNDSLFAMLPAIDPATGTLTYTPATDASGVATITVKLLDDGGTDYGGEDTSIERTFTITVNAPPVANNDTYTVAQDGTLTVSAKNGVLANDTDDTKLAAGIIGRSQPGWLQIAHGWVKLNADGSFTYTPTPGFHGTDTFTYKANDGILKSNAATVTITVTAPNHAPTAKNITKITKPGASVGFDVLAKAYDADSDSLVISAVTAPKYGTVTTNNHGTPGDRTDDYLVYQPKAGSYADDYFKYTISDGRGGTVSAYAIITVQGAALIPSADGKTTDLVVVGTSGRDTITVWQNRKGTNVTGNGALLGVFNPTGRIIVDGRAGDDTLDASTLTRGVYLYGGDGNDVLVGTAYKDVFSGGGGKDVFRSRGGKDTYPDKTVIDTVLAR